jgi:hypothetical protein
MRASAGTARVGVTKQCMPLTSPPAANSGLLPKAKPRAMRQHFVMSSIGSREVAPAERSGVQLCEDALKALDFGNSLPSVHSVSISNMAWQSSNGMAPACRACFPASSLLGQATPRDEINCEAPKPMPAFVMLARNRRQSRTLVFLGCRQHDR